MYWLFTSLARRLWAGRGFLAFFTDDSAKDFDCGIDHLTEKRAGVQNALVISQVLPRFGQVRFPGLLDPASGGELIVLFFREKIRIGAKRR